jgi:hypothetical protein
MTLQAGSGDTAGVPWSDPLGMGDGGRRSLARSPWPHDGAVLIQTPDMEPDLLLVREGHRHGVAVQGGGAPRTCARVVDFHPSRTSCLRHRFSFTRGAGAEPHTWPPLRTPPGQVRSMPVLPQERCTPRAATLLRANRPDRARAADCGCRAGPGSASGPARPPAPTPR